MRAGCTEDEFIALMQRLGYSAAAVGKELGISARNVHERRARIEAARKILLRAATSRDPISPEIERRHPARLVVNIEQGDIVIGSDCHYWPGVVTAAHRKFVETIETLKPKAVIMNGDVFDGGSISRYPRIGWDHKPTVKQELEACTDRLHEVTQACKRAKHYWTMGNHDGRMETKLAATAPEFEGVGGFALKDHFPAWTPCWSILVNGEIMVKHRYKGGVHAARNNALNAGMTTVTGHTHRLQATPITDYRGVRYGIECGTLAEIYGEQFLDYVETNPVDWQPGFVVLHFAKGVMEPELVRCEIARPEYESEPIKL